MAYTVVYTSPTYVITLETGRTEEIGFDAPEAVGLPDAYLLTYNSPGWEGHSVGSFATMELAMAEIQRQDAAGSQIKALGEQMLRDAREG